MSKVKLLPCPFCGGEPVLQQLRMTCGEYIVKCCGHRKTNRCPATYVATDGWTEQEAIDKWNMRRTSPQALVVSDAERLTAEMVRVFGLGRECWEYKVGSMPGKLMVSFRLVDHLIQRHGKRKSGESMRAYIERHYGEYAADLVEAGINGDVPVVGGGA